MHSFFPVFIDMVKGSEYRARRIASPTNKLKPLIEKGNQILFYEISKEKSSYKNVNTTVSRWYQTQDYFTSHPAWNIL